MTNESPSIEADFTSHPPLALAAPVLRQYVSRFVLPDFDASYPTPPPRSVGSIEIDPTVTSSSSGGGGESQPKETDSLIHHSNSALEDGGPDDAEGTPALASSSHHSAHNATKRTLSSLTLFTVLYSLCIGSGYGFESSVGAAGPLITLIFCLFVPWIWCLPVGLASAELATAVKSNSGVLMWVNVAYPPTISFLVVLITVFITFVGNAGYPSLAAGYVENIVDLTDGTRAAVKIGCVALCAVLNISGVEIVGGASVLMSLLTALPFLIFSVKQLFVGGYSWDAIAYVPDLTSIDWPTFLSITAWNYANVENAGSVVEEVQNPNKTMFRAMIPLMFSTYFAYFFPVVAGVSSLGPNQDYSLWADGYWSDVAEHICGPWLKYLLFAGAIVTSFGYLMTAMCCTSRLLAGMGQMQMFPRVINRFLAFYHPKLKTPVNAIVLNTLVTLVFSLSMSFNSVVALGQSIYCVRLLFVLGAVVLLRVRHPTLPRPYALPCSTIGCIAFLAPAFLFSCGVAILSASTSLAVGMGALSFLVAGTLLSFLYVHYLKPEGFVGHIEMVPADEAEVEDGEEEEEEKERSEKDEAIAETLAQ